MEEIGGQLRDSLNKGHFRPYYQPVIDLKSRKVVALEALARWDHPTKGVLGPDTFITVAEDSGFIDELFDMMWRMWDALETQGWATDLLYDD